MMPFAKIVCAKSKEFDVDGNEVNVDYERMMKIVLIGFRGFWYRFEGTSRSDRGTLATKQLIEREARS